MPHILLHHTHDSDTRLVRSGIRKALADPEGGRDLQSAMCLLVGFPQTIFRRHTHWLLSCAGGMDIVVPEISWETVLASQELI
jgi:hypothetical protein